jgi:parvulin-like peptidyl-prolyl isomerase
MNTQTERSIRKPSNQRGKGSKNAKRYYKQTAHVEARRDGKPLIFGWGKHLSHTEKVRIQRRATWGLAAFIVLLLAAVLVASWIDLNIVVPGLAITTVNGHSIPQSEYREMVAVKTQLELNKLYGPNGLTAQVTSLEQQSAQTTADINQLNTQITNLTNQIKKLPSGPSSQRTSLTNQLNAANKKLSAEQTQSTNLQNQLSNLNQNTIPLEKQGFTQSQIGNDSATWLQDDELIREWLTTQSATIQAKINPSASQVNKDFNSLKANMPNSNGYNTFLSQMGISDDQIRAMLTIIDRRNNAQAYMSTQVTSPSYQVLGRQIVVQTQAKANQVLQDLQKGQDFGALAKTFSQDTNTNTKGGSLGWLTRYQYIDAAGLNGPSVVENWLFDPSRHLNDLSPVLFGNGSYYIVQLMNVDPSRAVDATLLKSLQANALVDWLQDRSALPNQHISSPDQNMMFDTNNLPQDNILPASAPAVATPQV